MLLHKRPLKARPKVRIIKKGWDVEYCYICLARIGRIGIRLEYFCKSDNQWACAPCYENYNRAA